MKRSNTFVNVVAKALAANAQSEPAHIKARHEAEAADMAYRVAIRQLDRKRLGVEERVEETLKTLQRWETERLRAVKTGTLLHALSPLYVDFAFDFQCYINIREL